MRFKDGTFDNPDRIHDGWRLMNHHVRVITMLTEFAYYITFDWDDLSGNFILPAWHVESGAVVMNNVMLDHYTKEEWLVWITKNILLGYLVPEGGRKKGPYL